jgi:tRNA threonylcarbamoyl adenosine modification protein (Sua5/YciO/YrdC/YwlC family)
VNWPRPDLDRAIQALRSGHIIGLPTDTVYGIAADPFQPYAVESLFEIKGRPGEKPVSLLVADRVMAGTLGVFNPTADGLAARHWPGALTLVVRRVPGLPDWIGESATDTIGLRVPDHAATIDLLHRAGPLAVTSANGSGEPAPVDEMEAARLLGRAVAVYLPGNCPGGESSTVVDVTGPEMKVLRAGPLEFPLPPSDVDTASGAPPVSSS